MTEIRSNAVTPGALGILSGAITWARIILADAIGLRSRWNRCCECEGIAIEFSPLSLLPRSSRRYKAARVVLVCAALLPGASSAVARGFEDFDLCSKETS